MQKHTIQDSNIIIEIHELNKAWYLTNYIFPALGDKRILRYNISKACITAMRNYYALFNYGE